MKYTRRWRLIGSRNKNALSKEYEASIGPVSLECWYSGPKEGWRCCAMWRGFRYIGDVQKTAEEARLQGKQVVLSLVGIVYLFFDELQEAVGGKEGASSTRD